MNVMLWEYTTTTTSTNLSDDYIRRELCSYGGAGWELVSSNLIDDRTIQFFFKRPYVSLESHSKVLT